MRGDDKRCKVLSIGEMGIFIDKRADKIECLTEKIESGIYGK